MKVFWYKHDAAFDRTAEWIIERRKEEGLETIGPILEIGRIKSGALTYRTDGPAGNNFDKSEVPIKLLADMTPDTDISYQEAYKRQLEYDMNSPVSLGMHPVMEIIRDYVAGKTPSVRVGNKGKDIRLNAFDCGIVVGIPVKYELGKYSGEELFDKLKDEIDAKLKELKKAVNTEEEKRKRANNIQQIKLDVARIVSANLAPYGCKFTVKKKKEHFVLQIGGEEYSVSPDEVKSDWTDPAQTAQAFTDYILNTTFMCPWSIRKNSLSCNAADKWFQENILTNNLWLEPGKIRLNSPRYEYRIIDRAIILRVANAGEIVAKDGVVVSTNFVGKFAEMVKERNGEKYKSCREYALKLVSDLGISVALDEGDPILYGAAKLSIKRSSLSLMVPCNTKPFNEGVRAWKAEVKRCFTEAADVLRKQDEERKTKAQAEFLAKFGRMGEDFLVCDILEFIKANDRCITETAIGQAMHGNAISLNVCIISTDGMGKYTYYSVERIRDVVRRMRWNGLLRVEILEGGSRRNRYTFEALHVANNVDISAVRVETLPFRETFDRFKEGKVLTDAEAATLWKHMQGLKKTPANMDKILRLAHATGFLCRYETEIQKYFSGLDKDTKALLKMQAALEDDECVKKLIRKILKQV